MSNIQRKVPDFVGRPAFNFTPAIIEKVKQLAGQGLNQQDIALVLGISPYTLTRKKKIIEQLRQAMQKGLADAKATVTGKLYQNATEMAIGPSGRPVGTPGGSVQAQDIWMKRVGGFKDHVEVSGDQNNPIQVQIIIPHNGRQKTIEG